MYAFKGVKAETWSLDLNGEEEGEEGSRQEKNCFLILWMILPKSETSPFPPPHEENGCLAVVFPVVFLNCQEMHVSLLLA